MDPRETVNSTAEPAFATDPEGRIMAWNAGAERLLGHQAQQVLGRRCFELLQGTDLFNNRFCDEHCPIRSMVGRQEPVHQCRLRLLAASSERREVSVSVFVVRGRPPPAYAVVHLLDAVPDPERPDPPTPAKADARKQADAAPVLTARETEVLRMLVSGLDTSQIGQRLAIAEATVRNHVHHILTKMKAHSRLEAVCLAIRKRLL